MILAFTFPSTNTEPNLAFDGMEYRQETCKKNQHKCYVPT